MRIETTEPTTLQEPWRAMVQLRYPVGDVVDESGSGRSVVVAYGATEEEAKRNVTRKLIDRFVLYAIEFGWPERVAVGRVRHNVMWNRIIEMTAELGGDPLKASAARDAAARKINQLLSTYRPTKRKGRQRAKKKARKKKA